ncbi:hypothetical protein [Tropicibacter sp. S64]|uniref:hypothetical protein n=1 Tax=Tropicibacter sp. S64 TaxID=3415122 RepID=UPI003C7AB96D
MSRLSPETRTRLIEAFAFHAPVPLKRWTSARFGLPLRPEVRRAGVIFIHIPKNAGTTVSTQLYGGHIGHRSARFYRASDPAFFAAAPSFAISRDPLERFLSAFHFARQGGSASVPASPAATAFAQTFASPEACAEHIAAIGPAARDRLDPVFRSQSHYVCDEDGALMIGQLLRIEAIEGQEIEIAGHRLSLAARTNAGGTKAAPTPALAKAVLAAYADDYTLLERLP